MRAADLPGAREAPFPNSFAPRLFTLADAPFVVKRQAVAREP